MFDKILVATDGSLAARAAFVRATEIARASNAELTVLNVVLTAEAHWGYAPYGQVSADDLKEIGQKIIKDTIDGVDLNNVKLTTKVRLGSPELEIIDEALDEEIDLIVVGNKGVGSLKGTLLGGVSTKLLKISPVPVLLVKDYDSIRELKQMLDR